MSINGINDTKRFVTRQPTNCWSQSANKPRIVDHSTVAAWWLFTFWNTVYFDDDHRSSCKQQNTFSLHTLTQCTALNFTSTSSAFHYAHTHSLSALHSTSHLHPVHFTMHILTHSVHCTQLHIYIQCISLCTHTHSLSALHSTSHLHPVHYTMHTLSLIHIWRCRRSTLCRSRWSPYH